MDLCLAYQQYIEIGSVSYTLTLVTLLHGWYVAHYFVNETNVLAMMDFTADHMGWMLTWGNFVWYVFYFLFPRNFQEFLRNFHNFFNLCIIFMFSENLLIFLLFFPSINEITNTHIRNILPTESFVLKFFIFLNIFLHLRIFFELSN